MKANMYSGNRSFQLCDYEPSPPKAQEVQVDIAYCGICGSDLHVYYGDYDYRFKSLPRSIGHECSGVVAAVGSEVTGWKPGDRVVICPLGYCGDCVLCETGDHNCCAHLNFMGLDSDGALCNRWTVPAYALRRLPDSISLLHGALAEPLSICFHTMERAQIKAGESAVVIGAGPIGLMTALVGRYLGLQVLLSEVNPRRREKARSFGFTALDPTECNVPQYVLDATGGIGADIVFEVSGSQAALDTAVDLIHPHSRIVLVAAYPHPMQLQLQKLFMKEVNLTMTRNCNERDFDRTIAMLETAPFDLDALISEVLPLGQVQHAMERCANPAGDVIKLVIDCQTID